jgi:Fic family protein
MDVADFPRTAFGEARPTIGPHSYVAYFPAPLPRSFELPPQLVSLLAEAEAALGRLAGVGQLLPNPHLLIRPYLLREALASTMIEGTQASLAEIFELGAAGDQPNADVEEVLAYVDALEWAVTEAPRLPLSNRMLLKIHRRLLHGVRGTERRPGEFRTTQNWIGRPGSSATRWPTGSALPTSGPTCPSLSRTRCCTPSSRPSTRSSMATDGWADCSSCSS